MAEISFKERVKSAAIDGAKLYKNNFIDYEYLICSMAFKDKKYYIAKADEGNYLHLIGIHTELSPKEFFQRCLDGSLTEYDFDFCKKNQPEKSVKGSVRQKVKVLHDMLQMYGKDLEAQEDFKKNRVECAFATAESTYTLGYTAAGRPKSLLQKNELDPAKARKVDLVFRKKRGNKKYDELFNGDKKDISLYVEYIAELIDEKFISND